MSTAEETTWISPEAYLLGENDRAEGSRYEYVNGKVYAMVGASRAHNLIGMNVSNLLYQAAMEAGCRVFQSDMQVKIKTTGDERYYYPDVQVSCEQETETYFNTAPCLIVEVLSHSTERTDRTEKLAAYRLIDSLQEYLLLSQDSPHAELYSRANDWRPEYFVGRDELHLTSLDLHISLEQVYRAVFAG